MNSMYTKIICIASNEQYFIEKKVVLCPHPTKECVLSNHFQKCETDIILSYSMYDVKKKIIQAQDFIQNLGSGLTSGTIIIN